MDELAAKHDAALVAADAKIDHADKVLSTIQNPPAQVAEARTDLTGAKADIAVAREIGSEVASVAKGEAAKVDKLNHDFFSPMQKKIAVGIGITIMLLGLVIVLIRFGGLYGTLASLPIIGLIVTKISFLKPKA